MKKHYFQGFINIDNEHSILLTQNKEFFELNWASISIIFKINQSALCLRFFSLLYSLYASPVFNGSLVCSTAILTIDSLSLPISTLANSLLSRKKNKMRTSTGIRITIDLPETSLVRGARGYHLYQTDWRNHDSSGKKNYHCDSFGVAVVPNTNRCRSCR